ncbi:MAG: hypothetical protein Ct9H300mP8_04620 [Gammaproteobacteria bacterium]|nr:MAG: hypothetical protein Ct9H300mP8_04620 [Gammaproteobacteria bacterium]
MDNDSTAGGLHGYLGFETVAVGPGTMQGRLEVREELLTSFGNMQGAFCRRFVIICWAPFVIR